MKIVQMPIGDIYPYENNPRKNDGAVEYVANSIKQFGFQQPIVVDKNNVIVVGHTRYKAAKKLGLKSVPVVIADELTEQQVKAYRLADNKVGEFSEWDLPVLSEEIEEIFDVDMEPLGFFDLIDDPIDLEEQEERKTENDAKTCHCPKCGFVFEVKG